jgi:hypothetical protein
MNPRIALVGPFCVLASLSASAQGLEWTDSAQLPGVTGFSAMSVGVNALEVFDNGQGPALFAGGLFKQAGAVNVKCLARWNGDAWSSVALGFTPTDIATLEVYALLADGPQLYVGGTNNMKGFVSRVGATSTLLGTFESGKENAATVRALALFDGDPSSAGPELYAAGRFQGGSIRERDSSGWHTVGAGPTPGLWFSPDSEEFFGPTTVHALEVFDDGSGTALYVGGNFYLAGGMPQHSVARWDGSAWTAFSDPSTSFGSCTALVVFDDGSGPALYAAAEAGRVMRLVGTSWTEVAATPGGPVYALEVFDDGTGSALYAAGYFTSIGGTAANGIAKWDGVSWAALAGGLTTGSNGAFALKATFDVGATLGPALYVGGKFDTVDGAPAEHLAAWHWSDGVSTPYCFGDGSLATPCPCALPDVVPNPSGAPDAGCANSFNLNGARLIVEGPVNPDHARLRGTGLTPVGFSIFLVGNGSETGGVPGGDGIRCVAGSFFRFGVQGAVDGTIEYPNAALGLTHPLSVMSSVVPGSGQTRYYQAFYRSAQPGFCNPATFNFTSAVELVW